jgi:hypothetical protein
LGLKDNRLQMQAVSLWVRPTHKHASHKKTAPKGTVFLISLS